MANKAYVLAGAVGTLIAQLTVDVKAYWLTPYLEAYGPQARAPDQQ